MIDYSRDGLLGELSKTILRERYMLPNEESPQDAFARAARAFSDNTEHAKRLYNYASKLWFMFSTPVLSNGGTTRGLPISCFLNNVGDSREGICDHYTENAFLTSYGGGIGGYWGKLRPAGSPTSKGSESTGVIPFIKVVDSEMLAFSQGVTRRGSYAAYIDISHPEIEEFLDIRKPTGDINRKSLNLHNAVCISDEFMQLIERATEDPNFDDSWPLIDPNSGAVVKTVPAKALWIHILENRLSTGEPYIFFTDTVNNDLPDFQKELGLKVPHSNLCSEITLPTSAERTAVCCLSSVNLEEYDQWKNDANFIPDLIRMLDNVLQYFIDNAPEEMHRARYSATRERSIGLGAMGFHAFLQKKGIAIESVTALALNKEIFAHLRDKADKATRELALERGSCPDAGDLGIRNAHLLAVAPNASSSLICSGTSPSIEPYRANAYTQKTLSGSFFMKNEYLEELLDEYGMNNKDTWKSITEHDGSIQHLELLTDYEKAIFKTATEIDQAWLVKLAADRQKFICQSQSLNLFFPPNVHKTELHNIHMQAWRDKVKTLYYLRSDTVKKAKVEAQAVDNTDCIACEG